jgi:hypothetical protein
MKKILLIEDRVKRQQLFIEETQIDINSYIDILDNITNEEYYKKILEDKVDLYKYDIIIAHKSLGSDIKVIDKLKAHCKDTNTSLILFSGGISVNYYNDENFIVMEINSKTFYSKNLELFLKSVRNNNDNILMIPYGKNWKLNIILNVLESLNRFIEENKNSEDILFDELKAKTNIDNILSIIDENPEVENGWIYLNEIKNLRDYIYTYISELIDE